MVTDLKPWTGKHSVDRVFIGVMPLERGVGKLWSKAHSLSGFVRHLVVSASGSYVESMHFAVHAPDFVKQLIRAQEVFRKVVVKEYLDGTRATLEAGSFSPAK